MALAGGCVGVCSAVVAVRPPAPSAVLHLLLLLLHLLLAGDVRLLGLRLTPAALAVEQVVTSGGRKVTSTYYLA